MQFHFQPMTLDHAQQIDGWRYDGIYRFYNLDEDLDDREEFFDQSTWGNSSFAVVDENEELVGFFGFKRENEELVLGLGLHPDHSGKGLGEDFVRAGMEYGKRAFRPNALRLDVATFNQRAITVYERAGFTAEKIFDQKTNGGVYEFLRMTKKVD